MKSLLGGLVVTLSLTSFVGCASFARAGTTSAGADDGTPTLLTQLQLTSAMAMSSPGTTANQPIGATGWVVGSHAGGAVAVSATSSVSAIVTALSDSPTVEALEGSYPASTGEGGQYIWADYNLAPSNTNDIYIEFFAKMPSQYKGGCKFIKIFGTGSSTTNLSDTTIPADYASADFGAIRQILFGDGSGRVSDGQNAINLDGTNPQLIGRSYGTAQVETPQMSDFPSSAWGTSWHHFRIHVKYNSGTTAQNQTPDGEYYLEIDGKVYVSATGLYNRNPVNGPISYIEFFGWAQKDPNPFQLWFDDIRISTGGFMSQPLPDPPSGVELK